MRVQVLLGALGVALCALITAWMWRVLAVTEWRRFSIYYIFTVRAPRHALKAAASRLGFTRGVPLRSFARLWPARG